MILAMGAIVAAPLAGSELAADRDLPLAEPSASIRFLGRPGEPNGLLVG